jgi:predicted  nucleic acid-binding Zn-ribbon protein
VQPALAAMKARGREQLKELEGRRIAEETRLEEFGERLHDVEEEIQQVEKDIQATDEKLETRKAVRHLLFEINK